MCSGRAKAVQTGTGLILKLCSSKDLKLFLFCTSTRVLLGTHQAAVTASCQCERLQLPPAVSMNRQYPICGEVGSTGKNIMMHAAKYSNSTSTVLYTHDWRKWLRQRRHARQRPRQDMYCLGYTITGRCRMGRQQDPSHPSLPVCACGRGGGQAKRVCAGWESHTSPR